MNLRTTIRKVLMEEKLPIFLRRRVNTESLHLKFTECLEEVASMYKRNFSVMRLSMSSDKFKRMVISALMDNLFPEYDSENDETFPYVEIYTFLYELYDSVMEETYQKINNQK